MLALSRIRSLRFEMYLPFRSKKNDRIGILFRIGTPEW
jgi:hypothetical protein